MPIDIYIDHNVWDFLFARKIDLALELPAGEFSLHLTREAEFEIPPTPGDLRVFIEETIQRCHIDVRPYFGFFDNQHLATEQRVSGHDEGYWASHEEYIFIESQHLKLGRSKKAKTRLFKNEADISLAARSLHSVVLTFDRKPGPIQDAYKNGGRVIFLNDFDEYKLSLKEFILAEINK